jgi:hypothetical protein
LFIALLIRESSSICVSLGGTDVHAEIRMKIAGNRIVLLFIIFLIS